MIKYNTITHTSPPVEDGTDSVPKRRLLIIRRRGNTQKTIYHYNNTISWVDDIKQFHDSYREYILHTWHVPLPWSHHILHTWHVPLPWSHHIFYILGMCPYHGHITYFTYLACAPTMVTSHISLLSS